MDGKYYNLLSALCLSVHPSCKVAKHIIMQTVSHGCLWTLVFWRQTWCWNFHGVTPTGVPSVYLAPAVGRKNLWRSTHNWQSYKQYEIDTLFLQKVNRKSYAFYQTVTLLMTLSDPNNQVTLIWVFLHIFGAREARIIISGNWCNLKMLSLVTVTNRKWCVAYQIAPFLITLSKHIFVHIVCDREPSSQRCHGDNKSFYHCNYIYTWITFPH